MNRHLTDLVRISPDLEIAGPQTDPGDEIGHERRNCQGFGAFQPSVMERLKRWTASQFIDQNGYPEAGLGSRAA